MIKIINLIVGITILSSFLFILNESLKEKRPITIWLINCLNLILGVMNIAVFFLYHLF